ncbi:MULTISPECIES: hypothetical protein [Nocardioides]|uniref:Uncharacterized protein n=1 Tax=Nocardioides ganghwensis TaxID=252230 RepID=A0A4Q2SBQ8_9ACTN|nr:hypothetical protein [Nocardioides ganghwensis]MBD3945889.1 hypothetical protein [Nocardioides ganghwensis]RYB98800.1 hypothetical protein EUA07_17435 [Nocardioides ganghwensis]
MKTPTPIVLAAVVTTALTLTLAGCNNEPATTSDTSPTGASGSTSSSTAAAAPDDTSLPPWPAPADVPARVAAAGLDLGPMGTAEHYHPHLAVTIDGQPVPVPPNIGVDPNTGAMSAVHTHEGDGTIHIEAHTVGEKFTLGQLFTQWGVTLTPTQVGGVKAKGDAKVTVTSNGTPVAGDPADLRLEPDQQIELTLG